MCLYLYIPIDLVTCGQELRMLSVNCSQTRNELALLIIDGATLISEEHCPDDQLPLRKECLSPLTCVIELQMTW